MANDEQQTDYQVVFRTGKLWEFDLGREALTEHKIPFFAQTQALSGVITAVEAAPAGGPGTSWSLLVPRESAENAREILRTCRLDIEKEPEMWDFAPGEGKKKSWRLLAVAILILTAFLFVAEILVRSR